MDAVNVLKDYKVSNDKFDIDVIKFMDLTCTKDEVRGKIDSVEQNNPLTPEEVSPGEPTLKERLITLEFIGHLDLVARCASASNNELLGQEVIGIQYDIKALRLYLALTCIDIFCRQTTHHEHFITVFSNAPEHIKSMIESSLYLYKQDGTEGSLEEIGLFFYNVRNNYTHFGKRLHILEEIPLSQMTRLKAGTRNNKEDQKLRIAKGVKSVDLILSLALHEAKKCFGWAVE